MNRNTIAAILLSLGTLCACVKDEGPALKALDYQTLQAKSLKRGVSFSFAQLPENDISLLAPGISWSYNWATTTSAEAFSYFSSFGLDYCPMIWNANWQESTLRSFKQAHPECEYILAYNEPNLTDQANMVPSRAAEDWPRLVAVAKELNMKLIAPAMNYGTLPDYNDPWKWLDEFFAQPGVSLDDVAGIAIHCYMGSAVAMKNYLDKFKKYGKPIWLTEFCNWASNNISAEAQMAYMVQAVNLLEADPDVFRYAWFIPRGNGDAQCHNSLLQATKPFGLTDLGKVYINLSTQDTELYYTVGQVIPAEHYVASSGALEAAVCSDEKGVLEIGNLKKDVVVDYLIELPSDGTYTLELRYNSYYESPLRVSLDGESLGILELENTDYTWSNRTVDIPFTKGRHTLSLTGTSAFPVKLNWLRITNN